jgi:peptidoglycan/LPS O-acetylase OafA/YrhL
MKTIHDATGTGAREGRIASLDVVRGLAILMVITTHNAIFPQAHGFLYAPITIMNRIGWSGVDLFFVLSGFLVGGLLMREQKQQNRIDAGGFLIRRASKVWPSYFVFLAAYAAVQIMDARNGGTPASRAEALARDLWPNLLHVQNYFDSTSQVAWFWSLAVEEHFYLALPWVLKWVFNSPADARPGAAGRRMATIFGIVAAGCLLLRWRAGLLTTPSPIKTPYIHAFPTHLRVDSLFAGVSIAYLVEFHGAFIERLRPLRYLVLAVGIVPWVVCYQLADQLQVFLYPWGLTLLYLGAACVVTFAYLAHDPRATTGSLSLRRYVVPVIAWIGVRSYCIYVWHGYFAKPVANRLAHLVHLAPGEPGLRGWLYDAIYVAVPVLVGAAAYVLIEKPGLKLRYLLLPARDGVARRRAVAARRGPMLPPLLGVQARDAAAPERRAGD